MYKFAATTRFKKDLKLMKKRGKNLDSLKKVVADLCQGKLDPKYRDHALTGNYIGFRECHIEPDWLLIYRLNDKVLILTGVATGSHSDLF